MYCRYVRFGKDITNVLRQRLPKRYIAVGAWRRRQRLRGMRRRWRNAVNVVRVDLQEV